MGLLPKTCLVLVICFIVLAMGHSSHAQNAPRDYLAPHNSARAQVGVGPLRWDNKLAAYALNYARKRIRDCALIHSGGPYGENIYWGKGRVFTAADAVRSWVSEKKYYNYNSNTCQAGKKCGHYTQVVWRKTARVGCARVRCNNGAFFIICSYDPRGNYKGQRPYLSDI